MIYLSNQAEADGILNVAKAMCVSARTAPKTKGIDYIKTAILTGEDKEKLADKMDEVSDKIGFKFFKRDANNVRVSEAVVLIGISNHTRGLNEGCQYCGFKNCTECEEKGGNCAYTTLDLGIAIGSAVSIAADNRIDNRVMFSAGRAALEMDIFDDDICNIIAIPLSAAGKSPYFDRKS